MDKKTLTVDNRIVDGKKLSITATKSDIEREAKKFFGWRSNTKRYDNIFQRVMAQGSSSFDDFIIYMYRQGY